MLPTAAHKTETQYTMCEQCIGKSMTGIWRKRDKQKGSEQNAKTNKRKIDSWTP